MKLKLDENLPHDLVENLTGRGHDVDTVLAEQLGGQKDAVVVRAASDKGRMLLTLDRGVGDVRQYPPGSHAGVIVLRPVSQDPESILNLVGRFLRSHPLEGLRGCLVIVESQRIRVRRPEGEDRS